MDNSRQQVVPLVALALLVTPLVAQYNDRDNSYAGSVYSLTSYSDCTDKLHNIYSREATVLGHDISSSDRGPRHCTVKLFSQTQFGQVKLSINIVSMNIEDPSTILSIYDGQGSGSLLASFSSGSSTNFNRYNLMTSGDTVTFILERQDENLNFDIQVKVKPIPSNTEPGYENNFGGDYFDKFSQPTIVALIGSFYAAVLIVCIIILICDCLRSKGEQKRWETVELSTMRSRPALDSRSHVTHSSNGWSSDQHKERPPASQYSVDKPTYTRNRRPPSEEEYTTGFDHDDRVQQHDLMKEEREREKARHRMANHNASYADQDNDEADHFKEKVVTPRVKANLLRRSHKPPTYAEAVSDHSSTQSSEEDDDADYKSEASSSHRSTRKRPPSSSASSRSRSTRSSKSYSTSASESEESESEEDSRRGGAKGRRPKGKPKEKRRPRRRRHSSDESGPSRRSEATSQPSQQSHLPRMPHGQPIAYPAYPPGQFVPVMAGHPGQFQPVPMVPGYHAPYQDMPRPGPHPQPSQVAPTDPPVYSYLVHRGYKPLDMSGGRQSPATHSESQRSGGGRLDEPDLPLDSGVDYLRR